MEQAVVRDGHIITSRGAGTAFEFAVELLKYFNLDERIVIPHKRIIIYRRVPIATFQGLMTQCFTTP